MNLKILTLDNFSKNVKQLRKRYKSISRDLRFLQEELTSNPRTGIELGHNCYKIRLRNSSVPTGKSGGFRVVYYFIDARETLFLVHIYSKSDTGSISENIILEILKKEGLLSIK